MKALQFAQTGSLDDLELVEVAKPAPRAGEVLVELKAAGLNPSDVKNVLGRFPYTTVPRIPGRDFAGVVVEGPEALIGKTVWGSGNELGFTGDGSHAQYVVVPADGVADLPAALSLEQAASAGVPYVTAWDALERAQADAGSRVLVIGAGAVGRAAADLARWRGADVALAQRGAERAAALAKEGYQAIALDSAAPLTGQLPEHFAGRADVIFDTTGALLPEAVAALAVNGRIAIIAAPASGRVDFPALDLYRRGGTLIGVNSLLHDSRASAAMLAGIARGFATGALPPPPAPKRWPFVDALAAYRAVDAGGAGKVVFTDFS